MRYYDITITNADTGEIIRPKSLESLRLETTVTSLINGKTTPGALDIELNIPFYNYENPLQGSFVRIWGLALREVSQSTDLANCNIIVRAGMAKGLPLANPKQAGVIAQGKIYQAFGNWVGTDMTVDLQILPQTGQSRTPPRNFSFKWPASTPLSDAIKATLQVAMPGYAIQMAISPDLKKSSDETGIYSDLTAFAGAIADLTTAPQFRGIKTLAGTPYKGVKITPRQKTLVVTDGTQTEKASSPNNPKKILFQDFIGQPTWFSPSEINFKTVMRADLAVGDYVLMPDKISTPYVLSQVGSTVPGSTPRNKASFNGVFLIQSGIHFGRFRQPTADAWCTSFNAVYNSPNPLAAGSGAAP